MADPWLAAIKSASDHVFGHNHSPYGRDDAPNVALQYLMSLENMLMEEDPEHWSQVPSQDPPPFSHSQPAASAQVLLSPEMMRTNPNFNSSNNPYASIFAYDSDDDSGNEANNHHNHGNAANNGSNHNNHHPPRMNIRRLMIRILSYQADIYSKQASERRQAREWMEAANHCSCAIHKINQALGIADGEISRFVQEGNPSNHNERRKLEDDANVVSVSVRKFVEERDTFLFQAQRLVAKLERKLQPQWESRDAAKARIGTDFWHNNPNPSYSYAKQREADEREVKALRQALETLSNLRAEELEKSSLEMQQKLQGGVASTNGTGDRYNGVRPDNLSNRVSLEDYPDPTEFEWTFTGSNETSCVEFFEKTVENDGLVKLDWYYTTATIKTSLEHPTQGPTQLFGRQVDSETYIQILINPRSHTNQRYQRRNRGGGRGRGRSGRGRGGGRGRTYRGRGGNRAPQNA